MTKKIEIHDIVCGKIQIEVNDIIKLTPKDKPKFYGVKGSNCMITAQTNTAEDAETYYFSKETMGEVQAMTGEIKPRKVKKLISKTTGKKHANKKTKTTNAVTV